MNARGLQALAQLKRLQREVHDAYRATVVKILNLAVTYNTAYLAHQRDGERVRQLNAALGITDQMATRWRQIAEAALFVKRRARAPASAGCHSSMAMRPRSASAL